MKVIKHENEFGLTISFKELDKQFDVSFSGNGDLYWTICSENVNDDNNFIITKENYEVYRLFDKENNTITWYSDETNHEVANILKIRKENESFELEFYIQPYIEGYDRDFNSLYHIPINIVFMRMYEKMKQVYDINDYGHQIHIEEYLYNQNKIKKLTK